MTDETPADSNELSADPAFTMRTGKDGWVDLGGPTVSQLALSTFRNGGTTTPWWIRLGIGTILVLQAIRILIDADTSPLFYVSVAGTALLAIAAWAYFSTHRFRAPRINAETRQFRAGRRIIDFADIGTAVLVERVMPKTIDTYVRFGTTGHPTLWVLLRSQRLTPIGDDARRLLSAAFAQSQISPPPTGLDKYDPLGKFPQPGAPRGLSREQAIDVVLNTPVSDTPVGEER